MAASILAWCLKRFGVLGTSLIAALLAVALYLAFAVAYQSVTGYFNRHKIEKVEAQRDTAIVERDVARTNATNESKSADSATKARENNDVRVPASRAATAAAIQRATDAIESDPVVPSVRTYSELQDDAAAVARFRSAASRVRGTGAK